MVARCVEVEGGIEMGDALAELIIAIEVDIFLGSVSFEEGLRRASDESGGGTVAANDVAENLVSDAVLIEVSSSGPVTHICVVEQSLRGCGIEADAISDGGEVAAFLVVERIGCSVAPGISGRAKLIKDRFVSEI